MQMILNDPDPQRRAKWIWPTQWQDSYYCLRHEVKDSGKQNRQMDLSDLVQLGGNLKTI